MSKQVSISKSNVLEKPLKFVDVRSSTGSDVLHVSARGDEGRYRGVVVEDTFMWLDSVLFSRSKKIVALDIQLFLFFFRAFNTPDSVIIYILKKVKRYQKSTKKLKAVAYPIETFLQLWVEEYPSDLVDTDTLELLERLAALLPAQYHSIGDSIEIIRLYKKIRKDQSSAEISSEFTINLQWEEHIPHFAKQLTLYHTKFIKKVKPEEILHMIKLKSVNKSVHLCRFMEISHILTLWTATEILKLDNYKFRCLRIKNFIELSSFCLKYGNLNAYHAIWAGLFSDEIYRLKKSWKKVEKDKKYLPKINEAKSGLLSENFCPDTISSLYYLDSLFNNTVLKYPIKMNTLVTIFEMSQDFLFCKENNFDLDLRFQEFLKDMSFLPYRVRIKTSLHLESSGREKDFKKDISIPYFYFDEDFYLIKSHKDIQYDCYVIHHSVTRRIESESYTMKKVYTQSEKDTKKQYKESLNSIDHDKGSYDKFSLFLQQNTLWVKFIEEAKSSTKYIDFIVYLFESHWFDGLEEENKETIISIVNTIYWDEISKKQQHICLKKIGGSLPDDLDFDAEEDINIWDTLTPKEISNSLYSISYTYLHSIPPQIYLHYGQTGELVSELREYTYWIMSLQQIISQQISGSETPLIIVLYFIELSLLCFKHTDIASCYIIVSALNGREVGRLDNIWTAIQATNEDLFEEYWDLVRLIRGDMKKYRELSKIPNFVPYIGFHLPDFEYLCKQKVNDKMYYYDFSKSISVLYPKSDVTYKKIELAEKALRNIPIIDELPSKYPDIAVPDSSLSEKATEFISKMKTVDMDVVHNVDYFFKDSPKKEKKKVKEHQPVENSGERWSKKIVSIAKNHITVDTLHHLNKRFRKQTPIGSGGYASVFVAKDSALNRQVAVKKQYHESDRRKNLNYNELGYLALLSHKNILIFYSGHEIINADELWIITEFIDGATLSSIRKLYKLEDSLVALVLKQTLQGLKYLHQRKFVHRDLKSSNIMINLNGTVKIIDFGLIQDVTDTYSNLFCGSAYWIAPEVIQGYRYGIGADIWSLGVCAFEMFMQELPFQNDSFACMYSACTVGLEGEIQNVSELGRDILLCMLVVDASMRWTSEELLHVFLLFFLIVEASIHQDRRGSK
eukprot:TRINITY_DN3424_c0_g1_i4.p1 TRINITY_DN3424_c0_g1~~TRINITY_DN3424_c0_g1_i4.p1  ORF type:complete len:1129 (-),score=212.09 TRINITY_DN3424_c0_g1_i4:78-3464(-)